MSNVLLLRPKCCAMEAGQRRFPRIRSLTPPDMPFQGASVYPVGVSRSMEPCGGDIRFCRKAAFQLSEIQNEFFRKALSWYVVVSSPQHAETTAFLSGFPIGGIHSQNILLVIPLELQKKHQPFSMTQPRFNASDVNILSPNISKNCLLLPHHIEMLCIGCVLKMVDAFFLEVSKE